MHKLLVLTLLLLLGPMWTQPAASQSLSDRSPIDRKPGAQNPGVNRDVAVLIDRGDFAQAEQLLQSRIADSQSMESQSPDSQSPIIVPEAIQLEILRRTRHDFSVTEAQLLAELEQSIDNVTAGDLTRWRDEGALQHRVIDGEVRYFRNAGGNLFRISTEAKSRRNAARKKADEERAAKKFDLTKHIEKLVALSESSTDVFPVHHKVKYKLTVNENHPRVKKGAVVRAWLPFPQEYRTQRGVKLISSNPPAKHVAPSGSPHRSVYFEQTMTDAKQRPTFEVEFSFVNSAYCPDLDPAKVEPYDTRGELYREYTAERPPHIVFSPKVHELTKEIVGDEQIPLEKARSIFRWVSANIPWCSEMEYSIIPSLSAKGLEASRGDCGVQGMVFITLCRAAGVPARWQSGWQTKPGDWNMHDWSEFYVEPWGWLPADASYGTRESDDPRVRDFLCGSQDPYRLIVNLDYAQPLDPAKTSFRSEPTDFQRGEIEIDGHNLYFNEWSYDFKVETHRSRTAPNLH